MGDIDVGVAFMFFWGAFVFVAFVVVISILRAILEYVLSIKGEDDERS